ncbi:hypothetical protein SUGI_0342780 [Cryptomeria japonica]|uniref:1-aminocyclopropane-1-carboxylate oxidase n=1 Tax=Cryptomeria japonica TaxID=3369 RepID=UPI002408C9D0|nr:1-aminocyclopropane-1-carboxylate oxidase [Cryptomeria japonica]XP_059074598.1 1-aminocyclopropane-1-carboxylate oxidase-like [Cryptomeria japonica]GLJ19087.1 hypothetical protein SUGI_0342780 [Cryptomeria japonica]
MGVPVIDVKNIDGGDRKAIMAQIAQACESPGFFQIANHGIDHGLLDRVKEVCSQQYKINREQNFKDSLPVRALNRAIEAEAKGNNVDKIENMDWEDVFQVHEMKDTNSWPSEPKEFKEIIEEFRSQIFNLTEKLLEIISESLGLEKGYLKRAFAGGEKPFFGTKVSHYPPCPRPDLIKGIRAHTDAGGLILLYQDDEVPGLQVLNNGSWIDVQPMQYSIVVNIGDQIEAVSNGKYKSAWHRILPTEDGNRLSVASFYNPSYNALVSPAPQLFAQAQPNGNAGHELSTYPKYPFGEYMKIYSEQKYEAKEPRFKAVGRLNEQISC